MRTFTVDEEVVAAVWAQAKPEPFEDLSFNEALRRVLGLTSERKAIKSKPKIDAEALLAEIAALPSKEKKRSRSPRADLAELVKLGILSEGQQLIFVDYRGHPQPKIRAAISGTELVYQRGRHSMSALASHLLKKEGYIAESVRGPDHWATEDGQRIRSLWEAALQDNAQNGH
jgi:hypothetical protein